MAYRSKKPTFQLVWRISADRKQIEQFPEYAKLPWKAKFPTLALTTPYLKDDVVLELKDYQQAYVLFHAMKKKGLRVLRNWLSKAQHSEETLSTKVSL